MALVSFLLGACTDAAINVVNALVPSGGYTRETNIAYGKDDRQKVDVYKPSAPSTAPRPVVLFFYGGSWKYGSRTQYKFFGAAMAERGIVAMLADYRLYPNVKFPAFVEDGALALKWARDHAADYGGDPKRIYVMGHSAGANIAALVVLDPTYAKEEGADGAAYELIGLAGPYAFKPEQTESIRDIFLGTGDLERTRPINYADHPPTVTFLAHGRDDDTVYPRNTEQLAAALRAHGGVVETKFYEGIGHIGLMAAFAWPFRGRAPVYDDVTAFILKGPQMQTAAP